MNNRIYVKCIYICIYILILGVSWGFDSVNCGVGVGAVLKWVFRIGRGCGGGSGGVTVMGLCRWCKLNEMKGMIYGDIGL